MRRLQVTIMLWLAEMNKNSVPGCVTLKHMPFIPVNVLYRAFFG
jgi:hypothetical protein